MPGLSIRANGSSLPLVLIERIAHVRGGCTPGNSRLGVLVPSGDRSGPTEPAGETLASLVLIKRLTRVRAVGREKFSSRGWALLNFLELIYLSQKGAPFPAPHGLR